MNSRNSFPERRKEKKISFVSIFFSFGTHTDTQFNFTVTKNFTGGVYDWDFTLLFSFSSLMVKSGECCSTGVSTSKLYLHSMRDQTPNALFN